MKLVYTRCALCNASQEYTILYKKNFDESDFNRDIFSARRMPDRIHYQIVKCKNDTLVRSNPMLDEDSIFRLYQRSKFTYKEETENLSDSYLKALMPVLNNLQKTARILEIGCGNGFLLKRLYKRGYENIFGIEPSIDAAIQADECIRQRILTDILRPDMFVPHTFDLIFFFQTLDHIADPNNFLQMCYNLLAHRGFILSFNHDVDSLQAKVLGEKSPIIDIEHIYLYNGETMRKLFEKNNFKVLKVYSPYTIISLRHLLWLMPLPKTLKIELLKVNTPIFNLLLRKRIKMRPGNICLVAQS